MLDSEIKQLKQDYVIVCANYLMTENHEQHIEAIKKLARCGQIDALRAYFEFDLYKPNLLKRDHEIEKQLEKLRHNANCYEGQVLDLKNKKDAKYLDSTNYKETYVLYKYYSKLLECKEVHDLQPVNGYFADRADKFFKLTYKLAQNQFEVSKDLMVLEDMNEMFAKKRPKGFVAKYCKDNKALYQSAIEVVNDPIYSGKDIDQFDNTNNNYKKLEKGGFRQLPSLFDCSKYVYLYYNDGEKSPRTYQNDEVYIYAKKNLARFANMQPSNHLDGIKLPNVFKTQKKVKKSQDFDRNN